MTTLTVHVPTRIAAPRAAWIAAAAFARVLQVLHISQRARSERKQRSRSESDVAGVRRYAQQMMEIDPRFASELFAAADRHEADEEAGR